MQETINFIKWITELTREKRIALYSIIIIASLGGCVYGMVKFIEQSITRTQKECMDNNIRLTNQRDNLEIKLEVANDKIQQGKDSHLRYVEKEIEELRKLHNETNNLKKRINEDN